MHSITKMIHKIKFKTKKRRKIEQNFQNRMNNIGR